MNARFIGASVNFAVFAAAGLVSVLPLRGQIISGPSTASQAAPSGQVQKNDQPLPPRAFNGTWKLNASQSDDPEEKLRGTSDLDIPIDSNSPTAGQSTTSSNSRRSGGAGVPYGRSGGTGPLGGPINNGEDTKNHERMLDLLRSATSLTVEVKENEFDLTDERKQKRALFTDGRKLQKSKDDAYKEIAAIWKAGRLTIDEKGPRGEKISNMFQMSRDVRQLIETIQVDNSRIYSPVVIRYVYDPAPGGK